MDIANRGEPEPHRAVVADVERHQLAERVKEWLPRIGAYAVIGYLVAAPTAGIVGLRQTHIEDTLGTMPVTLSFVPGEQSRITALPRQNVYLPESRYYLAAKVQIDDLPQGGLQNMISPSTLQIYSGLYDNPTRATDGFRAAMVHEAKRNFWRDEAVFGAVAGAALLTIGSAARKRESRLPEERAVTKSVQPAVGGKPPIENITPQAPPAEIRPRTPKRRRLITGIAGLALVGGLPAGIAAQWVTSQAQPHRTYGFSALKGTRLQGTATDNKDIADAINQGIPKAEEFNARRIAQINRFELKAGGDLAAQTDSFSLPTPDEYAVLVGSDMHASQVMIAVTHKFAHLYDERGKDSGNSVIQFALLGGDNGYGSAGDRQAVLDEGKMAGKVPVYSVLGNHDDTTITVQQMHDAHMTVLSKQLVDKKTGLVLSGSTDPRITKYFSATEQRTGKTEQEVGAQQYATDKKNPADLSAMHEGYAAGSYMGMAATKASLTEWFNNRGSNTVPWEDGVRDLPTHLLAYGHWHEIIAPRTVWNSDGSWTEVMELNTMGGAIGDATFNSYSMPNTAPGQTASFPIVFLNKTSHLVTGYQMYTFATDGTLSIGRRIHIGSLDGQPYSPAQSSVLKTGALKRHQLKR